MKTPCDAVRDIYQTDSLSRPMYLCETGTLNSTCYAFPGLRTPNSSARCQTPCHGRNADSNIVSWRAVPQLCVWPCPPCGEDTSGWRHAEAER